MSPKLMGALIVAVVVAIVSLAVSSVYSSYVASTNHHSSCARTALILDSFHDVIQLAFTPQPGQTLTAKQVTQIQKFETEAFARLDRARC